MGEDLGSPSAPEFGNPMAIWLSKALRSGPSSKQPLCLVPLFCVILRHLVLGAQTALEAGPWS